MTEGAKMEECTSQNTAASIGGEHHANPYLNIQDIPEETNESVNIRSSDTITYEALHPYANIKDNTYSTLNPSPHQKGEERVYENTNISE